MQSYISILLPERDQNCVIAYFKANVQGMMQFYHSYEQLMMDCKDTCRYFWIPSDDRHMLNLIRFAESMHKQVGLYFLDAHTCKLYQLSPLTSPYPPENRRSNTLQLQRRNEQICIYIHDIVYIESQKIYILIHTTHGIQRFRMRLVDLLVQLDPTQFRRCHQSYIVNLDYIYSLKRYEIIMQDGSMIPVSKAYSKQMRTLMQASVMENEFACAHHKKGVSDYDHHATTKSSAKHILTENEP